MREFLLWYVDAKSMGATGIAHGLYESLPCISGKTTPPQVIAALVHYSVDTAHADAQPP